MTEKPTTLKEILGKFDNIVLQIFYSKNNYKLSQKKNHKLRKIFVVEMISLYKNDQRIIGSSQKNVVRVGNMAMNRYLASLIIEEINTVIWGNKTKFEHIPLDLCCPPICWGSSQA